MNGSIGFGFRVFAPLSNIYNVSEMCETTPMSLTYWYFKLYKINFISFSDIPLNFTSTEVTHTVKLDKIIIIRSTHIINSA